ncbi:heavy metal-binding domain-containing protein [Faecalicatena contorta]|uniref:heavy metal-binding domain-containing protein n=1 Tax=Faecalicatena contorta TaxID=39482 RepID=UPI001F15B8CB|nr:heavy metal-binding domain-containing protein [Faecalicatena contorta]MCF2554417.1 heavy metal-binding domain-containing protein [Faecalicatena contorta]
MISGAKKDLGFLYGEWSVGQNDFEKAFYITVEELKKRAVILGADAIVCMRQDIDLDTNGFAYFYLQMYGTAVKYLQKKEEE